MPSKLKMNLVCITKAAKIEMKEKWIAKINKIKQTVGMVYLT